jgi:hypothetical protein
MIRKLRTDWIAQAKSGKSTPPSSPSASGSAAPAPSSPVQGAPPTAAATPPAAATAPIPAAAAPGNDQALWKGFHDEFLSHGGPPIPLLRKQMLGPADQGPVL